MIVSHFQVMQQQSVQQKSAANATPKCDTRDSRRAAYDLLVALTRGCHANLVILVTELVTMHHGFEENAIKDFDVRRLPDQDLAGYSR